MPAAFLIHAAAAIVVALLLLSAGQPLFTEDTWWHLAMGANYAAAGPWLAADPLLHTAAGPPAPAAWLADVTLFWVERAFSFTGLRVFHALSVAAILALAWSSLRRASGSALTASLGTSLFGALAAYRLFQLRPELFSIFAALLLIRLLVASGDRPSWGRVAAATGLMALWANVHAGFVLGPVLLIAATAGAALGAWLRPAVRAAQFGRAQRLAAAVVLGFAATLANPSGAAPHTLYFAAGGATPDLAVVFDEWASVDLFALPLLNLPPSPLNWILVWFIVLGGVFAVGQVLRGTRSSSQHHSGASQAVGVDLALGAVALASIAALLFAVRFLWLGIFPLWVAAQWLKLREFPAAAPTGRRAAALGAVLLVPAFVQYGDWPMISQGVHRQNFDRPYLPAKYNAHTVWFLRDTGIEGRLWNDYSSGNFLGYWLAPQLRVFVNGSLNVPKDVMKARHAIERRGWGGDVPFTDLLDRYDVDVFFATGEPVAYPSERGPIPTVTHLAGVPGWTLVFRNLRSAVYVRAGDRGAPNLRRVADFYAKAGVPFDIDAGFSVDDVLRHAPQWAVAHGLVPANFAQIESMSGALDPGRRRSARAQLASLYAALGRCELAEALDRQILQSDPNAVDAARRRLWCLMHLGRSDESLDAASALARIAQTDDTLSRTLVAAARGREALDPGDAAALVATLPVFTVSEGQQLFAGYWPPEARFPERSAHFRRCGRRNDGQ